MIEFLEIVFAIVVFLLVLGGIVLVHEAGHFFFARKANILCHEFSIGMGPLIKQTKKGETFYSIRGIPLGGYVAMAGENMNERAIKLGTKIGVNLHNGVVQEIILSPKMVGEIEGIVRSYDLYAKDGDDLFIELETEAGLIRYMVSRESFYVFSPKQRVQLAPYDRCFESKSLVARALTIVAGSVMNFVLGLLIFVIVGLANGVPNMGSSSIGKVDNSLGAGEFLEANDQIISINNVDVSSWSEFQDALGEFHSERNIEEIAITINRDGTTMNFIIPTTIGINSVGVSNINASANEKGEGIVLGVLPTGNMAYQNGLRKGDIIYRVEVIDKNDAVVRVDEVNSWKDMLDCFLTLDSKERVRLHYYTLINEVHQPQVTGIITPYNDTTLNSIGIPKYSILLGVSPQYHFDLFMGFGNGFILFGDSFRNVFVTLGMVTGLIKNSQISVSDLAGPVGIFQMIQNYLSTDFITFLAFVGLLTVNIGIINLLPIPALDGGRLVFIGYEAITRRPVNKKLEVILNNIVFLLLMALMIFVTYRDILRF